MSKKITFQELIESIAKETDKSKQFTHDFLKDFADVINEGLKKDGNVNIAGLGKFKLQHVDEREGYNPQTEEKITIPDHNKVVFKPYKDLRELVNAPYAHMEAELIKDDTSEDKKEEKADDTSPTEETSQEDDFIPTAPPTSSSGSEIEDSTDSKQEEEENKQEQLEDPFAFDEEEVDFSPDFSFDRDTEEDEENDVVEFKGDTEQDKPEEENESLIDETEKSEEQEGEDEQKPAADEDKDEEKDDVTFEDDKTDTALGADLDSESENARQEPVKDSGEEIEDKPVAPAPTINQKRKRRRKTSSSTIVIAAAFILLMIAGSAWYFGFFSENGTPDMAAEQTPSPTETRTAENDQQEDPQSPTTGNQQSQQQAQPAQAKSQQSSGTSQTTNPEEELAIEEGQTLWSIAEEKYGNPRLWPWIYGNNGSLEDPDLIIAGNSLSIPLPSGPQNNLTSTDSTGIAKGYLATYSWYKEKQSSKAKNHLWAAKLFHENIQDITDIEIDKSDLQYVNKARQ